LSFSFDGRKIFFANDRNKIFFFHRKYIGLKSIGFFFLNINTNSILSNKACAKSFKNFIIDVIPAKFKDNLIILYSSLLFFYESSDYNKKKKIKNDFFSYFDDRFVFRKTIHWILLENNTYRFFWSFLLFSKNLYSISVKNLGEKNLFKLKKKNFNNFFKIEKKAFTNDQLSKKTIFSIWNNKKQKNDFEKIVKYIIFKKSKLFQKFEILNTLIIFFTNVK